MFNYSHFFSTTLIILVCLVCSACGSTPDTHFYTLDVSSQRIDNHPSPRPSSKTLGIGPLTIATALERPQIMTRSSKGQVELAEFHQWVSPLKESALHVIAENLSILRPQDVVYRYPWSAYGNVQYRVIIDLTRLDSDSSGHAFIAENWSIMNERNHQIMYNGHCEEQKTMADTQYTTIAYTFSVLLEVCSQHISYSLDTMHVSQ